MRKLALVVLLAVPLFAQPSGGGSTGIAKRIIRNSSLPATCSVSDVYFKTAATVGQYNCLTANNWSAVTIGGYAPGGTDVAVADGGTGLSTLTANNVILGNGTSTPLFVAPSTSGNVLTSNGTTWTSAAAAAAGVTGTGTLNALTKFTNATGPVVGDVTGSSSVNGGISLVNQSAAAIPFSITGASAQSGNYINVTANGGAAGGVFKLSSAGVATFSAPPYIPSDANSSTAVGTTALDSSTNGQENTAFGNAALTANTTSNFNTAIGSNSMPTNAGAGDANTAVGAYSLFLNLSGDNNVAIGNAAMVNNSTGNGNVAIGNLAGKYETGSNGFYINNVDQTNTAGDKANSLLYGTFAGSGGTTSGNTLRVNGQLLAGGSAPSVAGSCGTSPSVAGKSEAMVITAGTVAPTSCTVTFAVAFTNAPVCNANAQTTTTALNVVTTTTTVVVSAAALTVSEKLYVQCRGY